MQHVFQLSVHDIVDLLLRRGHLDTRIFNQASMQEGTALHSLYQSEQKDGYIAEYSLKHTFQQEDYVFVVSGKADGLIIDPKTKEVTIEEIKTTVADLDDFIKDHGQWHLGQAMFYAFMIAEEKHLDHVNILLTYLKQQNYHIQKQIRQVYQLEDLQKFVDDLILRFTRVQKRIQRLKNQRDESIKNLEFPFPSFRKGQKEMMKMVYDSAEKRSKSFIEAPTGIGKTISVLYPMVYRFGEKKQDKIFYLTSKNSIKKIAMATLALFKEKGAKCKSIEFTSQENICFNDKKGHCNPDECPFAKNYYDKLLDTIFDAMEYFDTFTRKTIEDIAYEKKMCPFQLQLDLSEYCDALVLDYSYVFDYHDRMQLSQGSIARTHTALLVDECHNLPQRVRDMYSLEIDKKTFDDSLSLCGISEFSAMKKDIANILKEIESIPLDLECEDYHKEGVNVFAKVPKQLVDYMDDFLKDMKYAMKKHPFLISDPLLEFFYQVNSFYYLATLINDEDFCDSFLFYIRITNQNHILSLRIANLNSRDLIKQYSSFFESTVYFSATLSPKEYYIDLLGGNIQQDEHLFLPSPFSKENRKVFIDTRLSLRYRDRDQTLYQVFSLCKTAIEAKTGNYFIFCPSFEYLDRIASFFSQDPIENATIVSQGRCMKENEREDFLSLFNNKNEKTTVGLLVLGGVFSEGIDLIGDRLIGAIVISAGLPQIGFERNHLKDYFDNENESQKKGFDYAYTYPGINKILQAGGRVIRSENDKGFLLYIDSRFRQANYQKVFKEIYPDAIKVISNSQVRTQLKLFWKEKL